MKGGDSNGSVYLRLRDTDYFRLSRAERIDSGNFRRAEVTGENLFRLWRAERRSGAADVPFLTGCMVLLVSEPNQRKKYRQIMKQGTPTNTGVKPCHSYLMDTVKEMHPSRVVKKQRRALNRKGKVVLQILREITTPLKKQWGYPDQPPSRDLFPLTVNNVVDLDVSDDCRQFMQMQLTAGKFDLKHRQVIDRELKEQFPDDAEMVARVLDDARITEPFAVISIPEIQGQACVGIANPQGQWLRLEAYKFCQLIEDPGKPLMLGNLPKTKSTLSEQPLAFNNVRDSEVVALLKASEWRLLVQAVGSGKGTAEFLLDMDHAVLVSTVLRRIRQDEEIFRRWQEKALSVANFNPFAT